LPESSTPTPTRFNVLIPLDTVSIEHVATAPVPPPPDIVIVGASI